MHPAEQSIRDEIDSLTIERVAFRVIDIKRDIKYAFWHGFIDEFLYIELLDLAQEKYTSLFELPF